MSFFFNNKNIEKNVDLDTIKSQSVQIIMNIDLLSTFHFSTPFFLLLELSVMSDYYLPYHDKNV